MIKRLTLIAAAVAALTSAQADASYTLTLGSVSVLPVASGGPLTFTNTTTQTSPTDSTATLSLLTITASGLTASSTGFYSISEAFSIVGTAGTETGSFTFGISVTGLTFSLTSAPAPSITSGAGLYTFGTINTPVSLPNPGTISGAFTPAISTAAVPEPASVALLGLGLAGVGAFGLCRRRSAK